MSTSQLRLKTATIQLCILHFALCVFCSAQEPKADTPPSRCFLWKAASETSTVYLLGSIHVASEDLYPLPPEIEEAFAASKFLVVEADVNKAGRAKTQALTLDKGTYKGQDTLTKSLSKPTLDLMNAYYTKNGVPFGAFDKFRPWLVATTITVMEVQKLGFRPDLGIDLHFLKAAGDKKEILELESIEAQMNLLSGFSAELQDSFLRQTLSDLGDAKENLTNAIAAWRNGDGKTLNDLLVLKALRKHPEMKPVFEKMIDERNTQMTAKIEAYLKGKGVYFVVVGAGHVVGDKGIVALLTAQGCKVEQVRRATVAAAKATTEPPAREPAPRPNPAPALQR